jgi:small subunit ribosomal protein S10
MLQIRINSFKLNNLNTYIKFLEKLLKIFNIYYSKISVPTKIKRITILKSPHVFKKAREQFELKVYTKNIIIKNVKNLNFLKNLLINKPKFININIKYIGK